jgi:shikimate dehydrogenase
MTLPTPATRLGVLGWPVAHSRSPAIHNAALIAIGRPQWRYQLLPLPPARLAETILALPAAGFAGVNVTIPHKAGALGAATAPSARARAIGAANTLVFGPGGTIRADNTDAPALIAALPLAPAGLDALVLGAGGSARAAVWALLRAGARRVAVWNRTASRARSLCEELGATFAAAPGPADLLVNCTTIGLDGGDFLKELTWEADHVENYKCVVDFVYSQTETQLVQTARARSVPVVDGLELLVRQGALSFEQFTGVEAPVEVMRAAAHAT